MYYVVDGSSKGPVDGAGVVFIDSKGKETEHSFTRINPNSNSLQAEAFALECAIELILKSKKKHPNITVYTDNLPLFSYVNAECEAKDNYTQSVVKQAILLKRYANLKIALVDDNVKKQAKKAHELSRSYMKEQFFNALSLKVGAANTSLTFQLV